MLEYLLLMHDDTTRAADDAADPGWEPYLSMLRTSGAFQGGSAVGGGVCVRQSRAVPAISRHITGFIRVRAESLEHARLLLPGNPVFEQGGTVEIRELPRT